MEIASKTGQVSYLQRGEQGKPGVMLYPAGEYSATAGYTRTALTAPMVLCQGQYYALAKEGTFTGIDPKADYAANGSKATWVLVEKMQYAFMEVLMANFAKLASAVFHGQYMFSQQGVAADGSAITSADGYKKFNPADPMNPANAFRPNLMLDFLTGTLYGNKMNVVGGIFNGYLRTVYKMLEESDAAEMNIKVNGTNAVGYKVNSDVNLRVDGPVHNDGYSILLPTDAEYVGVRVSLFNLCPPPYTRMHGSIRYSTIMADDGSQIFGTYHKERIEDITTWLDPNFIQWINGMIELVGVPSNDNSKCLWCVTSISAVQYELTRNVTLTYN